MLAVLLEDGVALLGILLTLLVAGISSVSGPRPAFDAVVAIGVGVLLGVMALFLAGINRRLLIDSSDQELDRAAEAWLRERKVAAERPVAGARRRPGDRVRPLERPGRRFLCPRAGKSRPMRAQALGKRIDAVYWKFRSGAEPADQRRGGGARAVASE